MEIIICYPYPKMKKKVLLGFSYELTYSQSSQNIVPYQIKQESTSIILKLNVPHVYTTFL